MLVIDASGTLSLSPNIRSIMAAEIRALREIVDKFHTMQVDSTEYACLKGIILFKTGQY